MKVYIAGPMSGYPNFNFPTFYDVEEALVSMGFDTVNPAALDEAGLPEGVDEEDLGGVYSKQKFLLRDFRELVHCDGIVLLPDWWVSQGANAELAVARFIGLEVLGATYNYGGWDFTPSSAEPDWLLLGDYVEQGIALEEERHGKVA